MSDKAPSEFKKTAKAIATYKAAINAKKVKKKLKKSAKALDLFQQGLLEVAPAPKARKLKAMILEYVALLYVFRGEIFFKQEDDAGVAAAFDAFARAQEVNKATLQNTDARLRELYCMQRRALLYKRQEKLKKATREIQQALGLARQYKILAEQFDCLEIAREVYEAAGRYDQANSAFLTAIKLVKKMKGKSRKPRLYFEYANFLEHHRPKQFPTAMEYFRKAAVLYKVLGKREKFVAVLGHVKKVMEDREDPAYEDFLRAVEQSLT